MIYLSFIGGLCLGSVIGFSISAILAANKIKEAHSAGFNRGKSITTNIIK